MMTVHDALQAWQAGEITVAHAMSLTGAADVMELHAFSAQSGVDIRVRLLPREEEQARNAAGLVNHIMFEQDHAVTEDASSGMSV
jgi:hypothetical protein